MNEYNEHLHGNTKPSVYENAKELRQVQTKSEEILWKYLRNRKLMNLKFRRQHPFENFVLDFYCHERKLCIEADGNIHNSKENIEYDNNRTRILKENGITVMRFANHEITDSIGAVLNRITEYLNIQ